MLQSAFRPYRHDHLLQTKQLMQRPNCHKSNSSGTVGIRNQLLPLGCFGIDFRHDQRNALLVTERRRVVDYHRAIISCADIFGVRQTEIAIYREEDNIALSGGFFAEQFHGNLAEFRVDSLAGTAFGSKDAQCLHGEGSFFEYPDDFFPDCAGGAYDADSEGGTHDQRR